ncbi:MAG: hypothetical protein JSS79_11385 [Bacteroidetes bacterium]|nr:hypothetical protein [Bacteroidota bacterium]
MKKVLLLFLVTCNGLANAQQEKQLFDFHYNLSPLSFQGQKDLMQTVEMNFRYPFLITSKTIVAGGIGYETLFTNQYPLFGGDRVSGLSTQWFLNRKLNNRNSLLLIGSGGIYSDFKDISMEDVRYSIGFRYKTSYHERFTTSYGLGLSRQFFGLMVVPFIDFDWKLSERLRISGPVPLNTRMRYIVNKRMQVSIFLRPDNSTCRLSATRNESRYFQKKQWNSGLGADYIFGKHWLMSAKLAYPLRRKLEIYDAPTTPVLSILTFELRGDKGTPHLEYTTRSIFLGFSIAWILSGDHINDN